MDLLSILASTCEACEKILLSCYRLKSALKLNENDISAVIFGVEALSDVIEELKTLFENHAHNQSFPELRLPDKEGQTGEPALPSCQNALNACNVILEEFIKKLEPLRKSRSKSELKWPFDLSVLDQNLETIAEHKAILHLATFVYQSDLEKDYGPSDEDIEMISGGEEADSMKRMPEVLQWYKASAPEQKHKLCRGRREPDTGNWIFDRPEFQQWRDGTGELLWLHGIPGAGKTILCSTIIDHMRDYSRRPKSKKERCQVVYYYFEFSDRNTHSLLNLLKSIAFQLISSAKEPAECSIELWKSHKGGLLEPTVEELLDVCLNEAAQTNKTILIIDALDEAPTTERGVFMEKCLRKLLSSKINILITSRKEPDIEKGLDDLVSEAISLESAEVDADVKTHVDRVIHSDLILSTMPSQIQNEISVGIAAGAKGMFRWAICQLDRIKQCLTPDMIREELKTMPETLDQMYERILSSVPAIHRRLVQSALRWLAFSARPLLLEELAEAAIIRPELERFDRKSSRLFNISSILELCGVLVTSTTINAQKERTKWLDEKGETETGGMRNFTNREMVTIINLSHYSVKEYILSPRLERSPMSFYYASMEMGNSYLGHCCLLYLLEFNHGALVSELDFDEYPLLEYASKNWMKHWELAGGRNENNASLIEIYERFFTMENRSPYINWLNVHDPDEDFRHGYSFLSSRTIKKSFDLFQQPLYWAAHLGDLPFIDALVKNGADMEAREGYFGSAFGAAARRGRLEVVEYFLSKGLSPNTQSNRFGAILQIAVTGGSKPVVERLIEVGADVNGPGGELWDTALIAAASNKLHDIVHLLLVKGAALNVDLQHRGSALHGAAQAGDVQLATILIAAGADVNGSNSNTDPTPLYAAADTGSLPIVNLLIAKGADVNKVSTSCDYRYPLLAAANRRRHQIVRTLILAGADPNLRSENGGTPLGEIILNRDMAAFKMLLDAGADINNYQSYYENYFQIAIHTNQYEMARILMDRGADLGQNSIIDAAEVYNDAPWVLHELLDRGVDVDTFAPHSGSPLSTALHVASTGRYGSEKAVRLLLERGAYVSPIDQSHYCTPLCLAARDGQTNTVKMLVAHGADVHRATNFSPFEMAISYACESDNLEIAEFLLESGVDISHDTSVSLYFAVGEKKPEIIRWLVSKGMCLNQYFRPKSRPEGGFSYSDVAQITPLQYAAKNGDIKMMKLLLDLGADINGPKGERGGVIYYGVSSKEKKVVEFLFERGAEIDDLVENYGIIGHAIYSKLEDMIPDLIARGANLNAIEWTESPLAIAFKLGKSKLVKLLKEQGATFSERDVDVAVEVVNKDSTKELQELLDVGFDPNMTYRKSCVLSAAIEKSDGSALDVLLKAGARLERDTCQTAFEECCKAGHLERIAFLLQHEQGSAFDLEGALSAAVKVQNNLAVVELLVEHGAGQAADKASLYEKAAEADCQKTLLRLLEFPMSDEERADSLGRALQVAVYNCNMVLTKWLLDTQGANINHNGMPHGSPLQACLTYVHDNGNQISLFRMLVERGANINPSEVKRDNDYSKINEEMLEQFSWAIDLSPTFASPLSLALAPSSFRSSLQYFSPELLALGADVNALGGKYHSPLQAAVVKYPVMVRAILDAGADVNACGGLFGTALTAAAAQKDIETAKLLLSRGADPTISGGDNGRSVLHAAAGENSYKHRKVIIAMMDLLHEAGADVHARDNSNSTAVHKAAEVGNVTALKWLAHHGANIRAKRDGKLANAYQIALENLHNNKPVQWPVVTWLEQHYGREGWDS